MKTNKMITTSVASALAMIMAVGVVQAETTDGRQNAERPSVATGVVRDDGPAMRDTKQALKDADRSMRENADEFRAFLSGNDPQAPLEPIVIRRDMTAESILKSDIVDAQGKKIASVDDILLDAQGRPTKIVVSEGGVMGVGTKKAAFDYSTVKTTKKDGRLLVTGLSEAQIKQAPEMVEAATRNASVSRIMDGVVLDSRGDTVAAIENVAFTNTDTQLIIKFNDTFGMGGNLAAVNVGALERVDRDDEVNYRLSDAQSTRFKSYKAAVE